MAQEIESPAVIKFLENVALYDLVSNVEIDHSTTQPRASLQYMKGDGNCLFYTINHLHPTLTKEATREDRAKELRGMVYDTVKLRMPKDQYDAFKSDQDVFKIDYTNGENSNARKQWMENKEWGGDIVLGYLPYIIQGDLIVFDVQGEVANIINYTFDGYEKNPPTIIVRKDNVHFEPFVKKRQGEPQILNEILLEYLQSTEVNIMIYMNI